MMVLRPVEYIRSLTIPNNNSIINSGMADPVQVNQFRCFCWEPNISLAVGFVAPTSPQLPFHRTTTVTTVYNAEMILACSK